MSFLSAELAPEVVRELEAAAAPSEQVVAIDRGIYAWHPKTIACSRLWTQLAGQGLGVTGTSRNWTTVDGLLALPTSTARWDDLVVPEVTPVL